MKSTILSLLLFVMTASGQKAPSFALPGLDGDTVSLEDLKGAVIVLDFWVMWCDVCREDMPKIHAIHKQYALRGVKVFGIHLEENDTKKVKEFVTNAGIRYPVLLDPEEQSADSFKIAGTPSIVIIDKKGFIAKKYRELNRKNHKELLSLLDSLTVGKKDCSDTKRIKD
ncbi:MAG: TlpA family protein disulfide reductase [Chitinispirillaceae bacterium]|nr:TlpA family protein disulfide reductase [Chitinispirillaceae bacterium]